MGYDIKYKMDILIKKVISCFNYTVVLIPIIMSICFALVYILGGWGNIIDNHMVDFYFLKSIDISGKLITIVVFWFVLIIFLTFLVWKIGEKVKKKEIKILTTPICIFIIALFIRFLLLYIYNNNLVPFSDFYFVWQLANGNLEAGKMDYYSLFPAYLNFSLYEHIIIKLFGDRYIVVLYLNVIYSALTGGCIYFICREIRNNEVLSIFAGILYALYPSNIIYITTGTPDFIAILFNTIGVFLLLKGYKNEKYGNKYLMVFGGGMALGVGGSFKTFSIVIMIAFGIIIFINIIIERKNKEVKVLMLSFIMLVIMLIGYKGVSDIVLNYTANYYGMELSTDKSTPQYILIGLNTESEGQIHIGTLSRLYNQEYLSNGMDYEAAKSYAYGLLKEDWKNNREEIVPNFIKKMIWAWQDDYTPVRYFLNNVKINQDSTSETLIYDIFLQYGSGFTQMSYMLVLMLVLVSMISNIKNKMQLPYEYIILIIFGYFCMIFLSEGQSRYKCLVMPYLIIITALVKTKKMNE